MRVQYSKPVAGLSAIQSQTFHELFGEYEGRLVRARYHQISARLHCLSIAHFGVWIEREARPLALCGYVSGRLGTPPSQLALEDLDAPMARDFF